MFFLLEDVFMYLNIFSLLLKYFSLDLLIDLDQTHAIPCTFNDLNDIFLPNKDSSYY